MRRHAPLGLPAHAPLVVTHRNGMVESVHFGSAVLMDADGTVRFALGDVDTAIYPRSAAKPLQATAMHRLGLTLPDELMALAAASHSGEQRHIDGATTILESAGLSAEEMRNTPDLPYGAAARESWFRDGEAPSRLAQNCSGKHAAMLHTCVDHDWPLDSYLDPAHPLQIAIAETIEDLADERIAHTAVDGCGAPLFAISLGGLARAVGRIARVGGSEAIVASAMRAHPELVAGEGRDVTALMRSVPGLLAKDGAEGVQIAALSDGTSLAVKVADGGDRARLPITLALLAIAGVEQSLLESLAADSLRQGLATVETLSRLGSAR